MSHTPASTPVTGQGFLLDGMSAVADRYDAFLIDAWGVLHDGARALPGAVDCLERLGALGKTRIVLSNASRRVDVVIQELAAAGVPRTLYDHMVTSGEHAWQAIREPADPWHAALGPRCYHLGPDRSRSMLDGLGPEALDIGDADYILSTGAHDTSTPVDAYDDILAQALEAGLPFVCANADHVAINHGQRYVCAGAFAERYRVMGGNVYIHGKPGKAVYDTCFRLLGDTDTSRIAAIGDSFHTDMTGAKAAGIQSIFICGGIHADELGIGVASGEAPDMATLDVMCRNWNIQPTTALPLFSW